MSDWKSGKDTPIITGYVSKDAFQLARDSWRAFSLEEQAEQFICAVFEEYIDGSTWEGDIASKQ